ncbi:MAG TPA: phosphate ABC transporter permease PstA [Gemmataceae bacterium]|jgi:phosphate transport system permease protein|nr:phosphate ABC transporter permease PstA [Gemmataceae bacterium]
MSEQPKPAPQEIDLPQLERSLRSPRTLFSYCMSVLTAALTLLAMVPLFSVLIMLLWRGGRRLSVGLFTELPPAAGMAGGGIANSILGTFLVVALATLISVPVGILGGVFLAEISPEGKTASAVRFAAKLLTGLPSILAGVFAFTSVVLLTGRFSPLAGGVALALLMLPTILLTAEEAIRMVPARMREAAVGMGATQTQVILRVLLPAARPGLLTGALLAISRAAGETAPLLFTMTFSDYWLSHRLMEPTASLAVLIFNFSKSPFENQKEIAWAASLVLVLLVLALNLGGQALSRRAFNR